MDLCLLIDGTGSMEQNKLSISLEDVIVAVKRVVLSLINNFIKKNHMNLRVAVVVYRDFKETELSPPHIELIDF
jgi:hypothetical protein